MTVRNPSRIVMPLKISHRGAIARWLPKDPAIIRRYHHDLLNDVVKKGGYSSAGDIDEKQLSLAILEFKKLIEENAEIFRDFHDMFDQVPSNPEPNQLSVSG
jgi:phosphatidylserine decarboxylase